MITAASNNINNLTLDATGAVTFSNDASTFNVLAVESDNGIDVNVNVTTDVGALTLTPISTMPIQLAMIVWMLPTTSR